MLADIIYRTTDESGLQQANQHVSVGTRELGALLPRLGGASLRDQVARALEARILDGTVAPGSRLPTEHELQESFGVSRTVIRDALRMKKRRKTNNLKR